MLNHHPQKVLIVDDDDSLIEVLPDLLATLGLDVRTASRASDALKIVGQDSFDLIVSDLMMPGVSGHEFMDALEARGDKTPVLFLSGSARVADVVKLMRQGAVGFLEKPFEPLAFKREVLSLLNARRQSTPAPPGNIAPTMHAGPLYAPHYAVPAEQPSSMRPPEVATRIVPQADPSPKSTDPLELSLPTIPPPESVPAVLGRYAVTELIASGGMGVVYRSHDPVLDREVALKVVRAPVTTIDREQFITRFQREAVSLAKLRHPHIVSIYDYGEDSASGLAYLVMELVEGMTLSNYIRCSGKLSLRRGLSFAVQMASALAYAHRHGIVHRDVKPENIVVGSDDLVRLIDFGIARLEDSTLTHADNFLGSPSYLSPESANGLPVDWRADQFSLATVILEMLSGERIFRADSVGATVRKVCEQRAPTLEELGVEDAPPGLSALLAKMQQKSAQDRVQDETELVETLLRLQEVATLPSARERNPSRAECP